MKARDDKAKAIDQIEELVCCAFHEGQTPEILVHVLFAELRDGLTNGRLVATLPRRTARQRVEDQLDDAISDGAFKNAIKSIRTALGRCRPINPSLLTTDDGDGVAFIEATIQGEPHLVFVRGLQNDGQPTLLVLEAEFRPLPRASRDTRSQVAGVVPHAVMDRPPDPLAFVPHVDGEAGGANSRLMIANETGKRRALLPQEIEVNLREILRNMSAADRMFRENEHARDLIQRHLSDVVEGLKRESQLWALGEIITDYADFSLLTGWVAKLHDGDELLGLTDWDRDCEWWRSLDGKHFLHANEIAISQKAAVGRTFVHNVTESPAQKALRIAEMNRHHAIGIDVRTISSSDELSAGMLPELRSQCVLRSRDSLNVLRGWVTYKVAADEERNGDLLNVFSINPQVIRANERMLEGIWKRATKYDPTTSDGGGRGRGTARASKS